MTMVLAACGSPAGPSLSVPGSPAITPSAVRSAVDALATRRVAFVVDEGIAADSSGLRNVRPEDLASFGPFTSAYAAHLSGASDPAAGALQLRSVTMPLCPGPFVVDGDSGTYDVGVDGAVVSASAAQVAAAVGIWRDGPAALAAVAPTLTDVRQDGASGFQAQSDKALAALLVEGFPLGSAVLRPEEEVTAASVQANLDSAGKITTLTASAAITLDFTAFVNAQSGAPPSPSPQPGTPGGTLRFVVTLHLSMQPLGSPLTDALPSRVAPSAAARDALNACGFTGGGAA